MISRWSSLGPRPSWLIAPHLKLPCFLSTADRIALKIVLNAVDGAVSLINMAAYSFNIKPVAAALASAINRGVTLRVVADEKPIASGTPP